MTPDKRDGALAQRVWDLPTRLLHVALILLFLFSWWSAEYDHLRWHRVSGYTVLALLLFRLYWGFAGSTTARFASFVRGPSAFVAYAKRLRQQPATHSIGHNPMGGWSVLALLALLLLQTGTGLFSVDTDGVESGPLSHFVRFATGRTFADVHSLSFDLLLALLGLHLATVLFYRVVRREDLITPMLGGRKLLPPGATDGLRFVGLGPAIGGLLAAAALVVALVFGLG
ncbi:cytochrome b/b6 domain-containing protein [Solimonas terrae]|uniref:Ni/Fe-hydrogenase 1 b-type cytochrome subunit n=1 Tax=Solimonas terrae TaxID=1396819 RepID=A0A6M2BVY5_9GAMM|nr:cytochrome b/b6 domain-containing protein [Solimonas terrae]NGY06544.1 Ni/Fe-hydrogenase 1 b-type cytochrome subunit [Solimonas terrae]